jgi:tetratricopeptide (TPR) repeat protein
VLAPGAVAVGFVAAWAIGRVIERDKSSGGLALAVATTCFACTIAWLALLHDSSRGIGWVRGFTTAEAQRPPIERALAWDYLGFQAMQTLQWDQAVVAWQETNRVVTTARTVSQLAMAQTMVGDLDAARANFRRALTIEPGQLLCWRGLATTSYRLGDYAEARRAVRELQRRGASPPELADLLRELDRIEAEQASERTAPAPAPSVIPHASARSHVPRASVMPRRPVDLAGPSSQVPERSSPEPVSR